MAAVFWPPESYLADAVPKKPIEVRFYEAATGKVLRSLSLALDSAERWTKLALTPDGSRLAVLLRPTRWPGKARLRVYASEDGKLLWERKIGAEDMAWLGDGRDFVVLGSQLSWLDAGTGNKRRDAEKSVHSSESQILRVNERGNLAVGHLPRYSKLKRALFLSDRRDPRLLVWRLDTGKELCELGPRAAEGADVWPTARGELIALEESYEVRPPRRLLRGASIVTSRVAPHGRIAPRPLPAPAGPAGDAAIILCSLGHDLLDLYDGAGQAGREQLVARFGDQHVVLDSHTQMFFWNVNARLDGHHHARFQRAIGRARVVDIQADVMAQSMNEVAAERAALLVLAVRVDVVVGDPKQAVGAAARKAHPRLERRQRRILRAQDDFVDLALPRGELAVGRERPGDVGGIAGVLPADVEHHEIAVFDLVAQAAVMQHR